ncbi:hypothetical protein AVEN_206999-1 [Araneus ventricosus]|uniref:Uncharacterized protein n=1 Tax=Araneus ventricosus TaxID=182803 RepID=A0A4Y2K613_ARAVE|nr:hypothetical protein AVEN_206999-1 [Araneus ventricosus]
MNYFASNKPWSVSHDHEDHILKYLNFLMVSLRRDAPNLGGIPSHSSISPKCGLYSNDAKWNMKRLDEVNHEEDDRKRIKRGKGNNGNSDTVLEEY